MRDRVNEHCSSLRRLFGLASAWALAAAIALSGCGGGGNWNWSWDWNRTGKPATPPPARATVMPETVASYHDTIGFYGDVPADQLVLVRGYGLVLLEKPTGSRECPPGIRKHIANQLTRQRVGETNTPLEGMPIDQWFDSMSTAAVEVRGLMPASGLKHEVFDVMVSALPGTQTTSLEGGMLMFTELSVWKRGVTGGMVTGKTMAVASGPIFINPFAEATKPAERTVANPFDDDSGPPDQAGPSNAASTGRPIGTPIDFRRGWVLGGGMILKDQPLQLVLREPDYGHSNIAMQQLNMRFPSSYPQGVARATMPNVVELKVPPEYRNQVNYWLALIRQIYLRRESGFVEDRIEGLVREIASDRITDAQRLRCALTFAAIGKPCLPVIQPLYSHEKPAVAFHSAYAGLRLGDNLALRVMLEITRQKDHAYRKDALLALGQPHPFVNIGPHLVPLLDEEDVEIRALAYEAVNRLGAPHIERYHIGLSEPAHLGFRLDIVRCKGPYLIYVTRAGEPKIVLFGGDSMRFSGPLFLANERTGVTLSAGPQDEHVRIMRINPIDNALMAVKRVEEEVKDSEGNPVINPTTSQPVRRMRTATDMQTSMLVADVIRRLGSERKLDVDSNELKGFGLNYGQIVHLLYQLDQLKALPCRMHLQQLQRSSLDLAEEGPPPDDHDNIEPGEQTAPDDGQGMIIERPTGKPKIGN